MSRPAFRTPDYDAPLDVDAVLARVPDAVTPRSLFPHAILEAARRAGRPLPVERFFPDAPDCSMRDVLRFLPVAAQVLHPDVPVREGLRRIGRLSHAALTASPQGAALFDKTKPVREFLERIPRGVSVAGTHGTARIVVGRGRAVLSLDDYCSYVEGAIGAIEAGLDELGRSSSFRVRERAPGAIDLEIRWSPP